MLKIGITGNIGSGKTTICRIFEHLGIDVYYSDVKAKQFYNNHAVKQKIEFIFGKDIFTPKQTVDFKKLADIVFNDAQKLASLNTVLHPLVIEDFLLWHQQRQNKNYVLLESAILFQCGFAHLFDKIIFVDAPLDILFQRCMQRDNANAEAIKSRIEKQQKNYEKQSTADFIICNNEKESLIEQVFRIHSVLNTTSQTKSL